MFYILFCSILTSRILSQGQAVFSETQRGFLRLDSCLLNIEETALIMTFQKAKSRPGLALFVNLRKELDTICHRNLLTDVNLEVWSEFAKLVRDL